MALSTHFNIVIYNSYLIKVDDNIPQHNSRLVHSILAKRIGNFSAAVKIYSILLKDPLMKDSIHKGLYKGNFESLYLHIQ